MGKHSTDGGKPPTGCRAGAFLIAIAVALGLVSVRPAGGSHAGLVVAPIEYVKRLVEAGQRPVLVDLRPSEEYRSSRLPGALSLPLSDLSRRYVEIPHSQRVVLYCACPRKDLEDAYKFLVSKGYENASVMLEGFPDWVSRGHPVER